MTPGTVAVCADEAGRFTQFAICIRGLQIPAGSRTQWQMGNDIAGGRNRACDTIHGEWLWFIDDDHGFAPDILTRLIARDVDIVAPIVLRRQAPFHTVACKDDEIYRLNGDPPDTLVEVEATGSAGMLIRRHVIEALEPPLFELGNGVSEDINFCRKARAAGFKIHVDLSVPMSHITTCSVWPVWDEERGWLTGLTISDGCELLIDPA